MYIEYSVRKKPRLKGFNYGSIGAYFITVCAKGRQSIFGKVEWRTGDGAPYDAGFDVGRTVPGAPYPIVCLSDAGIVVDEQIKLLNYFYPDIMVDNYVIMPNHIHILISITKEDNEKYSKNVEKIPRIIGTIKRFTNAKAKQQLWQTSYHDHIIRDENDYINHWTYITDNPARWAEDEYFN